MKIINEWTCTKMEMNHKKYTFWKFFDIKILHLRILQKLDFSTSRDSDAHGLMTYTNYLNEPLKYCF